MTSVVPRTALITGASSGIGRELAYVFAEHGHHLVLVARRARQLNELARELRQRAVVVETIAMDLGTDHAAADLARELSQRRIRIDVLVNNAGFAVAGLFSDSDARRQQQLVNLNVLTPTLLMRTLLPQMVSRGYGRILNMASIGSFMPGPTIATYFASKAYLLSLSRALSNELRGAGVTCTALVVGPTKTEFPVVAGLQGCRAFSDHLLTAREVAEAGFDAAMRGRPVVTVGLRNKLRMLPVRILPDRFLAHFAQAYHAPVVHDDGEALSGVSL